MIFINVYLSTFRGVAMGQLRRILISAALACFVFDTGAQAQMPDKPNQNKETTDKPDLTKEPTLYVVGYAHLDTEWRWEYPQVINEYLRKTMEENFALFEKYPHYVFNFSGANRYRLMKEYYPAAFAKLTEYVHSVRADGFPQVRRWKKGT